MKERFSGKVENVLEQSFTLNGRTIEMVSVTVRTIPESDIDASQEDFDDGIVEVTCFSNDARYNALRNSFVSGHVTATVERSVNNGRVRRSPIAWKYDPAGEGYEPAHKIGGTEHHGLL